MVLARKVEDAAFVPSESGGFDGFVVLAHFVNVDLVQAESVGGYKLLTDWGEEDVADLGTSVFAVDLLKSLG